MTDSLGRPPARLLVPAVLGTLLLLVPLVSLVLSTPWSLLGEQLASSELRQALWLSVLTATVAMLDCLLLGLPLAWVLARPDFTRRGPLLPTVPLHPLLPPEVAGVASTAPFGLPGVVSREDAP